MDRIEQAAQYFESGYNCAQAVAAAYGELLGMTPAAAARAVCAFGGGMGRMREVCGAVSGMLFVVGSLYGYESPNPGAQKALYAAVQHLAGQFRQTAGSIVCRELLDNPATDPKPTPRTPSFYAKRPCTRMVVLAASLLEDYIRDHPLG